MKVVKKRLMVVLVSVLLPMPLSALAERYRCDDGSIVTHECPDGGIAHIIPEEVQPRRFKAEPVERFHAEEASPSAQAVPDRKADAQPSQPIADGPAKEPTAPPKPALRKKDFVGKWNASGFNAFSSGFGTTIFYGAIEIKDSGRYSYKDASGAYSIKGGTLTFTSGPLAPNIMEMEGDHFVMKWTQHPEYSWWGLGRAE